MKSPIEKQNILLIGHAELTVKDKKMFKYFGVGSKIKPPYRILNPHRISIGDKTSVQEHAHINAFENLIFLMDYIEDAYRKDFRKKYYRYNSNIFTDRECQIALFFFATCTSRIRIHRNVLISERVF